MAAGRWVRGNERCGAGIQCGELHPNGGLWLPLHHLRGSHSGGIGSPYGVIAGALVVGIATEVSAAFISSKYKNAIALVILIIALLLRPQGIFASRGRA